VHNKITIKPKNKQDKENREKITTPKNVYPVQSNNDLLWGGIELYNPLSMSSLQRDTKWLQEINFNKLSKNNLISTHFSISSHE